MKIFFALVTIVALATFMTAPVQANEFYQKMNCLQTGGHWANGYCEKRKSRSSSVKASKQLKGDSEYYYNKSHAIDLAETEIMNKASEYCGTSYKSELSWHDYRTNCKQKNGESRCKQYATVTCLSKSCGSRFCGTGR